jgi:hypothetical protein
MDVQEAILIVAYGIVAWLPTLDYTDFAAFAVCFFTGYWLRGREKRKKTNEPEN